MPLDPLATDADLEARLGRSLTAAEAARSTALLADAAAIVRGGDVTGQEITQRESVVRRRVLDERIVLPQRPVNAVSAVTKVDGEPVTRYRWNGTSIVYVYLYNPTADFEVPPRPGWDEVDVTYDHGLAEVPEIVVAVNCNMVLRALGLKPGDTVTQERIEGYEYRRALEAVAGIVGILPAERAALRPYSAGRKAGTIRLS